MATIQNTFDEVPHSRANERNKKPPTRYLHSRRQKVTARANEFVFFKKKVSPPEHNNTSPALP